MFTETNTPVFDASARSAGSASHEAHLDDMMHVALPPPTDEDSVDLYYQSKAETIKETLSRQIVVHARHERTFIAYTASSGIPHIIVRTGDDKYVDIVPVVTMPTGAAKDIKAFERYVSFLGVSLISTQPHEAQSEGNRLPFREMPQSMTEYLLGGRQTRPVGRQLKEQNREPTIPPIGMTWGVALLGLSYGVFVFAIMSIACNWFESFRGNHWSPAWIVHKSVWALIGAAILGGIAESAPKKRLNQIFPNIHLRAIWCLDFIGVVVASLFYSLICGAGGFLLAAIETPVMALMCWIFNLGDFAFVHWHHALSVSIVSMPVFLFSYTISPEAISKDH